MAHQNLEFEWITAQWTYRKQTQASGERPIRCFLTFMLKQDAGKTGCIKKVTWFGTQRYRDFKANTMTKVQQQAYDIARSQNHTYIGKFRVTSVKGKSRDLTRNNIGELAASGRFEHNVFHMSIYTGTDIVDLVFDQKLSGKQQEWFNGQARWGNQTARPADSFDNWLEAANV